ncbi:adhesion G-protein coupled receptor G7-like [Scyliorhinus canicula]|uniref:adhesion G-protein coupled receptor G7-like n=1 Tax=Scyliorhinus canicula TaxID=7830 RepID=UPI0018F7B655|nr:adhesion G-protein coupled receptor G7-like [Scyliorhinus canicula]
MQNETSPNTIKPVTSGRLTETTQAPTITIASKSTTPNLTISTPMQTTPQQTITPTSTPTTTTPTTTTPTTTTPTTTTPITTTPTTTITPTTTTPSVTSMPTSALPLRTTTRTWTTTPKDPCNPNPCKNNGSCIVTNEYVCICPSDWTGIDCSETGSSLATRHCMHNGSLKLSTPEEFDCCMNLQDVLSLLNDSSIKKEKAASQVVNLTKNPQKLTVASVASTTDILTTIMEDPIALKIETFINIIQTFCNLLEANPDIIIKTLANLERLTQSLENLIVFKELDQVCPQVAVKSNAINSTGSGLVSYQNNALNLTKTAIKSVSKEDDINNSELEAYIFIPENSFEAGVHIGFILYKDASFFPTPKKKDGIVMKTQVISGTVANHNGFLAKPVTIKFRTKELNDGFYLKDHECAYWNYTEKEWQTNGCQKNGFDNGTHFTCECCHLTSFAVLMTVKGKNLQYLDTISYIGCALSILGLLATIIAPMWMRDYRRSVNGKLQINLSVALLGVYITFLAGAINPTWANASPEITNPSEKTSKLENPFCTASTWFLHFFLLASFAWMCVQGIALFSSYNRLIQQMERSYFVAVSAGVAWGAAALIAIITIAAKGPAGYRQERICWLAVPDATNGKFFSAENVLLWAFMLPVALVLILNLVIFGLIMSKMVCNKRNLRGYRGDFKKTLQKHFVVIFANTVTLGVCWITGYLMLIEAAYEVFSTIFCILNSLQGLFIFLLCFMNVKEFQNRMLQPFKVLNREKKSNISMSSLIIKGD